MEHQALWQTALGELELALSKANFTTWFKNTFISSYENGQVIVSVPNTFTKAWLEKKYHDAIVKALRATTNNGVREVTYRVEVRNTTLLPLSSLSPEVAQEFKQPEITPATADTTPCQGRDLGLNPRYTFKNFVVGKNNELAHAAAMAVAAKPGQVHNPLVIYGGVGMGKSHLLQAIGHHLLVNQPEIRLRYVTSDRFTNEFIQAVRSGHGNDFKDNYRNIDVLIIDDIQFISGREGTQEEFFHTFNALHQADKQIIIASDRAPKDIPSLEARLLSRFEWGLMADISLPDFETRVAILQSKARDKNYPLSTEILHTVAGAIQSNIRELEGALNKIVAYHQFKNIQPTVASVQPILMSFAPSAPKHSISPRKLLENIVNYYDITMDDILGQSRERRFALPRQIAMYLLREEIKCSFPAIGKHVGGRDHTTAMHACSKICGLVKEDEQLKRDLILLRERLYSSPAA